MKKIGEGWQYSVYDLGNGRVLKRFHSLWRSYWVILKTTFPFKDDSLTLIPDFSRNMKRKALLSYRILSEKGIPSEWLGNPRFINELDFEQDKVTALHDVFARATTEETKKIIDAFIIFNSKLLELGVIDKSFNITKNYGLNKDGEIVLIDIGELFEDTKSIYEQIKNKAWAKQYVAGCIEDVDARDYFLTEMDKCFGAYLQE